MGCPPYQEIIHEHKRWIILRTGGQTWYNYITVDLAHHEIFSAKVGKGGIIKPYTIFPNVNITFSLNEI